MTTFLTIVGTIVGTFVVLNIVAIWVCQKIL